GWIRRRFWSFIGQIRAFSSIRIRLAGHQANATIVNLNGEAASASERCTAAELSALGRTRGETRHCNTTAIASRQRNLPKIRKRAISTRRRLRPPSAKNGSPFSGASGGRGGP